MPFCSYSGGNILHGITPVENMFIIEYMPNANAEYVKVYLYMLMQCAFPGNCESISDVASLLKLSEDTVNNALKHWEREGLIQRMTDNPPTFSFLPLSMHIQNEAQPGDVVYENRNFNRELQSIMPGLVIDSHELRLAGDWLDVYGLDRETALFMCGLEMEKYKNKSLPTVQTVFKHLNETAQEWAENGVTSIEKARDYAALQTASAKTAEAVIRQFGLRRNPTRDEIELARKWQNDWNLSKDAIIDGCAETVKSASPSFAYLDKILDSRRNGTADTVIRSNIKTICMHLGILSRPTPAQIEAYNSFEAMGFEFAAIEEAAKWCGANNRRTFEDLGKKLEKWKDAKAFTIADIEEERRKQNHSISIAEKIFEQAGISRKVNASDIRFANLWTSLLSLDTVLVAAQFSQGTETPMKYIDKLIRTWSATGINTPEKALAQRDTYRAPSKPQVKQPMITRNVTEDEFGTDFYSEIMNRPKKNEASD